MEILSGEIYENSDGEAVEVKFDGKVTALYFSAGWCPPCRRFTPLLKQLHDELEKRKSPFQVIFISLDRTVEEMRIYIQESHGNWLSVPFGDPLVNSLREKFHIDLVPKLIVLRPDGSTITANGRKEVQDKGIAAFRVWQDAAHLSRVSNKN